MTFAPFRLPQVALFLYALLLGTIAPFLPTAPAMAAEQLVITYGNLQAGLDLEDLETLAETGEAPGSIQFYLNLANLDPAVLQTILTTKFSISPNLMTDLLSSEMGEYAVSQAIQIVHAPSHQPTIRTMGSRVVRAASDGDRQSLDGVLEHRRQRQSTQAFKATVVQSIEDDEQISLLEFLQKYPTQDVYLDVVNLIELSEVLQTDEDLVERAATILQENSN